MSFVGLREVEVTEEGTPLGSKGDSSGAELPLPSLAKPLSYLPSVARTVAGPSVAEVGDCCNGDASPSSFASID